MAISTIGRYQILERLGQGGMGVVYRAFDPLIERTVAVKVISAHLVDQAEHRERFFREARAAGRLAHRNIITIFDLGEDDGQPFIAMEYVEGISLDVRMRTGEPLTLSQKIRIAIDICDALAFAHSAGIIHRDMKPGNVMLTPAGGVRILDFGLARLVTSELTRSNAVVGTMSYIAPEQVRAEPIDHRADVFSVGVLLYELLSGRKAFEADSFAATMYKVLQERPAPLTDIGVDVPSAVAMIVDRAIEKQREHRYQSMGDMLRDLEEVRAALPVARPILMPAGVDPEAAASSHTASAPRPEFETTLDAPRVLVPGTVALGSRPARPSPLLSIISAAALVGFVVAVVAFVVRSPGERVAPGVDGAPRAATLPAPAAATAPGATGAAMPAAPPAGAVSITDDVEQQTESARALYRAGKYDEAAHAAGRVLRKAPGNVGAQRLMTAVAGYARQAADEAVAGLAAARARAESAGAPSTAGPSFAQAAERERSARALLATGDFPRATTEAYAAQGLFEAAAAESLGRVQARAAAEPPAGVPPSGSREDPRATVPFPVVTTVTAPLLAPASAPAPPKAAPVPAAPLPPDAAPERRAADPHDAIRRTLQQYAAALEARSVSALKQVWPGLGGGQERAIKAEFDNARQITVSLESPRIQVSGETATVDATRHYALATIDGHELRSDTRSTFQLRATASGWAIESVRFDAAR